MKLNLNYANLTNTIDPITLGIKWNYLQYEINIPLTGGKSEVQ